MAFWSDYLKILIKDNGNTNTSNNIEKVLYNLHAFISRTGGTASLPHYR